jgi:Uma2 family endonuclease
MEAGIPIVWAIDSRTRTAIVYRPGEPPRHIRADEALTGEEVLPGFRMELREAFS